MELISYNEANLSDLDRAQELAWDAWDEPSSIKRKKLALQALELSKDCADAYAILAEETKNLNEAIELYTQALEAGKRAIGEKNFQEWHGQFWRIVTTRPFMRAKAGLAECLKQIGQTEAAIAHYQEILTLNPSDNQGIRHELIICLFRQKRKKEINQLFKQYPYDQFALWMYHKALWTFSQKGISPLANRRLTEALKVNAHVPIYLLGQKKIPKLLPDYIKLGDETEAMIYAYQAKADWSSTPSALAWLKEHVAPKGTPVAVG